HMDGFQVMEALKPMELESWLPVLVVTAEPDKKLAALEAGARDFIGKPFDTVEVLTRIRNLLEVRLFHKESRDYGARMERKVRADGQGSVPVEISWQLQQLDQMRMLIAVARDISERIHAAQRLKHMSNYDSLTGLPNRTLFFQTLRDAIELAQDKRWRIAVLFITLDRFKVINDSLGPAFGDELLRQFSTRLVRCVRQRDSVGRLGGDEFAHVLTMAREQTEDLAVRVANDVREALREPFDLNGQQAALTAS